MSHSTLTCPKCGELGYLPNSRCPVCGFLECGVLRLRGTHGPLDFRLGTQVGRPLLRTAIGDDARFADHHQFTLLRDPDRGWLVEAVGTKSPTLLQGTELRIGVSRPLVEGDLLSIGRSSASMTVELLRGMA